MPVSEALRELVQVIEEENRCLRDGVRASHAAFANRKLMLLRDLTAAIRSPGGLAEMKAAGTDIRPLLDRNAKLLELHMSAVRDVAAIIVDSIAQAESDGTYSRSMRRFPVY